MFCTKCGKEIDDDAMFCPECGAKVGQKQSDDTAEEKLSNQEKKDSSVGNTKKKKKPFKTIIAGAILLLALVATGAWYVYPYSFDKTELNNGGYYVSKRYKKISKIYYGNNDAYEGFLEIERRYYDAAGKTCTDDYGWHKYAWEYNSRGHESKTYCYGMGKDWELCITFDYDGDYKSGWTRYNHEWNMKENSHGFAKVTFTNAGVSIFGTDNKPTLCKAWWAQYKDENNKLMYFDSNGKYTTYSSDDVFSGWAICEKKKDGIYLYDADMKPANCKAGWHSLTRTKEGKGKIAIIFRDKRGNWVCGDPSEVSDPKSGWNWSIYVNHDESPEGYTVWYDQEGYVLADDESASETKKKHVEAEEANARPNRISKKLIFLEGSWKEIDNEYYRDYVDEMFETLRWTYDMKDICNSRVAYPIYKSKGENKKENK